MRNGEQQDRATSRTAMSSIAGFHLFPFGGLRKAAEWLRNYDADTLRQMEQAAIGGGAQNP